jgi:hypothetical protein
MGRADGGVPMSESMVFVTHKGSPKPACRRLLTSTCASPSSMWTRRPASSARDAAGRRAQPRRPPAVAHRADRWERPDANPRVRGESRR